MLVLSRKVGEGIFVPELGMTVTIIELTRDRVRLGFSAPLAVTILREEICNQGAASVPNNAGEGDPDP